MFSYLDPLFLIQTVGLIGVIFIIFAESGLFFGFFLPGDSLLFTAGVLASQELLPIAWLAPAAFLAAVLGDAVGYWTGRVAGVRLFTRDDSFFFKKRYALKAKDFYDKHGPYAIIMARFIPAVRTFAPIVAGVARMNYRVFTAYNLIGGAVWALGMTGLGYFLGRSIPSIEEYILPIVIVIIALSFLPGLMHLRKRETKSKKSESFPEL